MASVPCRSMCRTRGQCREDVGEGGGGDAGGGRKIKGVGARLPGGGFESRGGGQSSPEGRGSTGARPGGEGVNPLITAQVQTVRRVPQNSRRTKRAPPKKSLLVTVRNSSPGGIQTSVHPPPTNGKNLETERVRDFSSRKCAGSRL